MRRLAGGLNPGRREHRAVGVSAPGAALQTRAAAEGTRGRDGEQRRRGERGLVMAEQEIGIVGLGTIGGGLARNFASHGARVAVYNRTHRRTEDFIAEHSKEGDFVAAATLEDLAPGLKPPPAL